MVRLNDQNKTQKQLIEHLGIKNASVFSDWKSGRNSAYKKHLPQISEFLDCSADYFLGKEKPQTVKYDSGLSENTILICRGGDTKQLHFTKDQIETIEKMLESIGLDDSL